MVFSRVGFIFQKGIGGVKVWADCIVVIDQIKLKMLELSTRSK